MNSIVKAIKNTPAKLKDTVDASFNTVTDVSNVVTAFKTVKAVKSGIDTTLHPVEWMRDKVKSWILGALKSALMLVVKKAIIEHALNRIEDSAYQTQFEIEPPASLKKYLFTEEGIEFLHTTASTVLNEPLYALGLKLGRIHFEVLDTSKLACVLELRLHSTKSEFDKLAYVEPSLKM